MAHKVWRHSGLVFGARSLLSCRKLRRSPCKHCFFFPLITGTFFFFFSSTPLIPFRFLITAPVSIRRFWAVFGQAEPIWTYFGHPRCLGRFLVARKIWANGQTSWFGPPPGSDRPLVRTAPWFGPPPAGPLPAGPPALRRTPGRRGFTRQPESPNVHTWSSKHHQNSTRRHPEREEKNEILRREREKRAKFRAPHPSGSPPFGPPTLRASIFSGPRGLHPFGASTLSGPPPFRGLHPFGASTLSVPPPFRAPTLSCPHPSCPHPSCPHPSGPHPFCVWVPTSSPPQPALPIPSPHSSPTPPHPQKCPQLTVAEVGETVAKTGRGQNRSWPK